MTKKRFDEANAGLSVKPVGPNEEKQMKRETTIAELIKSAFEISHCAGYAVKYAVAVMTSLESEHLAYPEVMAEPHIACRADSTHHASTLQDP